MPLLVSLLIIVLRTMFTVKGYESGEGPRFGAEPPNRVDFLNSTGAVINCMAFGNPSPKISWKLRRDIDSPANDVPGLRETLVNGSLVLRPMRPEQYRQDIHASTYNCEASNSFGSLVSRDVRVTGVVDQQYEIQVYDEFVLVGNTAVLRCHIPSFLKDYLVVNSWLRDDVRTITSTTSEGGRYSVFPSGELHIRNATQQDSSPSYRCQMTHKLTNEKRISATSGRLIVTDSSGTVPPRVTHSPQPIAGQIEETVEVPCAAQGFPVPLYQWFRLINGTLAQPDPSRSTQLSGSLILRQLNFKDSGKYLCVVRNSAGEERAETSIVVRAPLVVNVVPNRQEADVGRSATFTCNISGNPRNSISWLKNGRGLETLGDNRLRLEESNTRLRITGVNRDDAGLYQCFVSNDFESAQGVAQLSLGDALPVFHEMFSEVITEPGRYLSIKCIASGNPLPQIHWKLDGAPLNSDDRLRYTVGDYITTRVHNRVVSYVNISSVAVEDGGLYECEARNSVGSKVHRKRINVYGKPNVRPMADVKATAGQRLILRCPASGYPIDSIDWLKGPNRLPVNKRQEVFENGTLILHDIQKVVDDGTYTCKVVQNNADQVAAGSVRVVVMVGPMIDPFDFPKSIQQGMRARLVCTVMQGDPPFTFRWFKDARELDPSPLTLGVRTDDFSSDLTFSRVVPRHNGNYTCTVANDVASVSHTAVLVVDVPPYWKVEPLDASVVAGQSVRIECLAEGFPPPIITWERGSENAPRYYTGIASGPHFEVYANGSLLIKNAEQEDAGYFLCSASNSIGPGLSRVVTLTVHAPPRFTSKFQSETVRLGDEIILKCEAIGDNPMTILWHLDKQPITSIDDTRFERKEETREKRMVSSLKIESAKRRDSALFTCLVNNAYGEDEMNIRLIVQEPPEPPRDAKVVEERSRTAKLGWSLPFNGNNQITKYWITCHAKDIFSNGQQSFGHINVSVDSIPADEGTAAVIRGLRPATIYVCTVRAENDIGLSSPGQHIELKTEEEAPGGPPLDVRVDPLDARSAQVSWQAPEKVYWNGDLKGYYIGYKVSGSQDQYLYKTLEISSDQKSNQVILNALKPFTEYVVLVQAYNAMGAGPRSDEVTVSTLEDVPSQGPDFVRCVPLSSQSISLSWEQPPFSSVNGILQGYKVIYRPLGADISQVRERVTTAVSEIKLVNLLKYTNYSVEVLPFNRKGNGAPSKPIYCRTADDVPGQPSEAKAVVASGDSAIITWKDPVHRNGVITKYTVYWRELNKNRTKTAVTVPKTRTNVFSTRYRAPETYPQYKLSGLRESVPYEVWITASTRQGEGQPTPVVSVLPLRNVAARILEFSDTITINSGEFTPFVLGCHSVGLEPIQKSWKKNGMESLTMEADGSLVIQSMIENSTNFTCVVTNHFGFDEITYQLIRVSASDTHLFVKVVSTSFTSCKVSFYKDSTDNQAQSRGYELYYRVSGSESHEWQVKPIFSVLESNQTASVENLVCGTSYQLYVTELQRGTKSETVSFRTQGSAPVAPKKEEVLKLVNESSIYIYPSAWDQAVGCPIVKLTIEFRHSNQHSWKLVSSQSLSSSGEPVEISNIQSKSIYSVRMTAHTKGSPSTMAEYEVRVGVEEEDAFFFGNGVQRGLVIDTTTLVSLISSSIVLVAGCVAVICLIAYKRRSTRSAAKLRAQHYRRASATSCSVSGHTEESTDRRGPVRSDSSHGIGSKSLSVSNVESVAEAVGVTKKPITIAHQLRGSSGVLESSRSRNHSFVSSSPVRGKLPTVHIPKKQLEAMEKDIYTEYDEITPYATFRLTGDEDATTEEEFKTFSVRIGEPAYMIKGSLDGAPTTSRDYKMLSCAKTREDHAYHCSAINSHSITSGSSNQEELMHAYEYGRRYHHPLHHQHQHPGPHYYDQEEDEDEYCKTSQTSEADTPTDPGIRQFTKSPPKPNEKRQGACFTPRGGRSGPDAADSSPAENSTTSSCSTSSEESSRSTTPVNEPRPKKVFGAISRDRSRKPSWSQVEPSPSLIKTPSFKSPKIVEANLNMFLLKKGLSSDEDEEQIVGETEDGDQPEEEEEDDEKVKDGEGEVEKMVTSSKRDSVLSHQSQSSKSSRSSKSCQKSTPQPAGHGNHQQGRRRSASGSRVKRPPLRTKSTADEIEC